MHYLGWRLGASIIAVLAAASIVMVLRTDPDSKIEQRGSKSEEVEAEAANSLPSGSVPAAMVHSPGGTLAPQVGQQRTAPPSGDSHEHMHRPVVNGLPSEYLKRKPRPWGLPETPLGRAMTAHLDTFEAAGPNAQRKFDQTLAKLRADPRGAAKMAYDAYQRTPKDDYASRSALSGVLTQLESHEAMPALKKIALEPVPPEISRAGEAPELSAEGTIRIGAVRGLGELASRGNTDALQALADAVRNGDPTVRRYAAQMYVEAEGDSREARRAMAALLPEDERAVVEARPMSPGEQPQPEPALSKPSHGQAGKEKPIQEWRENG